MELIVSKYDYDYFDDVNSYVSDAIREYWVEQTNEAIEQASKSGLPTEDELTEIQWIGKEAEEEIDNAIKVSEENWRTWSNYNGELAEAFAEAIKIHEEEFEEYMSDYYDEPDR